LRGGCHDTAGQVGGSDVFQSLCSGPIRDTDSGQLARELVRKVARHHLTCGNLPDAVIPKFEMLTGVERLRNLAKDSHATYTIPAFKPYPYGVDHTNDPQESQWLGPNLSTSD
jgi:hypothetical protein